MILKNTIVLAFFSYDYYCLFSKVSYVTRNIIISVYMKIFMCSFHVVAINLKSFHVAGANVILFFKYKKVVLKYFSFVT